MYKPKAVNDKARPMPAHIRYVYNKWLNSIYIIPFNQFWQVPIASKFFLYNKAFLCIIHLSLCPLSLGPFSRASAKLRKATLSFVMSVRSSPWNNMAPNERIFMKYDNSVFFENTSRTFKFHWNLTRITGTLHEDQNTFFYYVSFISS